MLLHHAPAEQLWYANGAALSNLYLGHMVFYGSLEEVLASRLLTSFNPSSHLDTSPKVSDILPPCTILQKELSLRCSHADVRGEHKCCKGRGSCWAARGGHAGARQSDEQTRAGEHTAFLTFPTNRMTSYIRLHRIWNCHCKLISIQWKILETYSTVILLAVA